MSELKVGDKVLLQLGASFEYAPRGLRRWDGCKFVISKAVVKTNRHYYELKACKSEKGIPYAIAEDWLTLVRSL